MNTLPTKAPVALPWRAIGVSIENCISKEEILETAELDYIIHKGQGAVVTDGEFGKPGYKVAKTHNWFFLYRKMEDGTNEIFSPVNSRYKVVQNHQVLEICEVLKKQGICDYAAAGAYNNGADVFIIMRINPTHDFKIYQDSYQNFLMINFRHDGGGSIVFKYIGVRIICNNQIPSLLHEKDGKIAIRHTDNAKHRLAQVPKILKMLTAGIKSNVDFLTKLYNTPISKNIEQEILFKLVCTDQEYKEWFGNNTIPAGATLHAIRAQLFRCNAPIQRQIMAKSIWNSIINGVGQEGLEKTYYRLLQGITSYYYNEYSFKDSEHKFKALYDNGSAKKMIEKTFKLMRFYVKSGK